LKIIFFPKKVQIGRAHQLEENKQVSTYSEAQHHHQRYPDIAGSIQVENEIQI
jgi:hypothetical protein